MVTMQRILGSDILTDNRYLALDISVSNMWSLTQVLSERWAAVWNWAEEWKEKLNQALIDWEKFREEEQTLLTWLSSKEQTLDTIRQTDITDENQVKANLSLFEVRLTQRARNCESTSEVNRDFL